MPCIESRINIGSSEFRAADSALRKQTADWQNYAQQVKQGGGTAARQRHQARGKLFVRDRIELLLDAGSPFLEIGLPAAREVYEHPLPAAGLVAGIGWIQSQPCMIVANDATVKGGVYYPLTVKKHLRAQEIAEQCRLPCIYLVDSGGAFLRGQDEVFPDRDHFGRIFYNQARLSAAGIPQIAAVMGTCTAGGAYIPAMADETIIVKNTGAIYLAGPPLLKAATGEITDSQTLGGAKTHAQLSGLADYAAENDEHAIALLRNIIGTLPKPQLTFSPASALTKDSTQTSMQSSTQDSTQTSTQTNNDATKNNVPPPRYSADELYGIAGGDARRPFDMREVIARLVDDSDFDEFKPLYGETLITGFARIGGMQTAFIANNGALFSQSAQKGAHFIQLAASRKTPLIFLHNISGFMVGEQYEAEGIAKYGALMVGAVSRANIPKISLIIGGSYGAGNYAMCGRAYSPDFIFSWPNARIAVMGGEQAAMVMDEISPANTPPQKRKQTRQEILQQFEKQSAPQYASARLWDDGVIDPAQTRAVLQTALAACQNHASRFAANNGNIIFRA